MTATSHANDDEPDFTPAAELKPGSTTEEGLIEPSHGWISLGLGEVWRYRELLLFMAWRDIKVRYKQTVLGVAWAVVQPLVLMIISALFLGKLLHVPSDGVPYPLFVLTALVPWTFFANGLTLAANSVVNTPNLITKVYFPRLIIPTAVVLGGLPDVAVSLAVLMAMMARYGMYPSPDRIVWLPLFLLLAMLTALGVGLWLSALNVKYRDVRHIVAFLAQVWMFATPVLYPASLLSARWRVLYSLNPMVGVVEGFRWALLRTNDKPGAWILTSVGATLFVLVSGMFYFRSMEKTFADSI